MTASFLVAGIGECVVLLAILLIFRKGLFANEINRRMAKLIAAFALSLPLFRYVAFNIGFSIADTLAAEAAAYSMGYAALALLSGFSPWLGFAAYAANAILGVHHPEHIYELTAGANFLAIGYLALVWRRHAKA